MTAISAYPSTICMVSYKVSPLATEEPIELRFRTSPPNLFIAVSNDIRVRVEFSKKRFPKTLPWSKGKYTSPLATGTKLLALSRTCNISSFVRLSIVIRSPTLIPLINRVRSRSYALPSKHNL